MSTPIEEDLSEPTPAPANPKTTIAFNLTEAGDVTLEVYDVAGRHVRTLVDGPQTAGRKSAASDGRDDRGHVVGSGGSSGRLRAPGAHERSDVTERRPGGGSKGRCRASVLWPP